MDFDAGIGSILLQIFIGLVLAIPIFLKMYYRGRCKR